MTENQPAGKLPSPAELVAGYNDAIAGTPLVGLDRTPSRSERVMLVQAIEHPALGGRIEAWTRYCRWAAADSFLRGDREGGYPASLNQLCRATTIDRWKAAQATRQSKFPAYLLDPNYCPLPDTPATRESRDPNRRWNPRTQTWDYVYPPGFLEAVEEFTVSGPLPEGYSIENRCRPLPGPPRGGPKVGRRG